MFDEKDQVEKQEEEVVEAEQNTSEEELSEEKVDSNENDQYQAEVTLWKDQCRRISAEFENFKKRTERDQIHWSEIAKESILKELLSLVDDFDRAMQQSSDDKGLEMIRSAFIKLLEKHQVSVMNSYDSFDPEYHEAIMQVESADHETGQIVQVLSQGFMIKDRVLRPAKVSVAQ